MYGYYREKLHVNHFCVLKGGIISSLYKGERARRAKTGFKTGALLKDFILSQRVGPKTKTTTTTKKTTTKHSFRRVIRELT